VPKEDFKFYYPFRVRYSEIDGQKVVFNAHYLTYFDTAITEYFRWLPFDYASLCDQTGHDFHTVRSLVEYKAPIHFDEEIEVFIRIAKIGRSSLSFVVNIYAKDEDQLRATGDVVWVYTDQKSGRPAPVNEDLVTLLRAREGESLE
jgi:acyl-CoA thioester hydrolase